MSGMLGVVGNDEFWSQADFTQDPYFLLDNEFIDCHIDNSVEVEEWDAEDTATSESSSSPTSMYNGPRLLPKIREQDRVFASVASSKTEVNGGRPPSIPPLARCIGPNKTIESFSSTADGFYDPFAQQMYAQEQLNPPRASFELTSSNPWPHTPGNCSNYVPSLYDSNFGLLRGQIDNPYSSYDGQNLPCFVSDQDFQNPPHANKSRTNMPPVEANHLTMYPSSYPRVYGLAQNSLQSSTQIPTSITTYQSHYLKTGPAKKSTLLQYLGLLNPAPNPIKRIAKLPWNEICFFDVRNVRMWTEFKIETMLGIPELLSLLLREVPCDNLPTPHSVTIKPATEQHLRFAYRDYYGVKLYAALRISNAQPSLQMHSRQGDASLTTPDFTSSINSGLGPVGGNHVVGIMLPRKQWGSEMRGGNPNEQIRYLYGLARLQHALRENNCRYGFIITEIELVCVRYGGDDTIYDAERNQDEEKFSSSWTTSSHHIPIFGFFEVSEGIDLRNNNMDPYSELKMTAGLALWYLHMQAQDQALPGHLHWKIQVGTSAAVTRHKNVPVDSWVPRRSEIHKREAKRLRGWVMAEDPLYRKTEAPKKRRAITGRKISKAI